jgi:hypothetical protein
MEDIYPMITPCVLISLELERWGRTFISCLDPRYTCSYGHERLEDFNQWSRYILYFILVYVHERLQDFNQWSHYTLIYFRILHVLTQSHNTLFHIENDKLPKYVVFNITYGYIYHIYGGMVAAHICVRI